MLNTQPKLKTFLIIISLAFFYYLAAKLCTTLIAPLTHIPAFWPAAGIALAFTLKFGTKALPGVFIGGIAKGIDFYGLEQLASPLASVSYFLASAFITTSFIYLAYSLIRKYSLYPSRLINEISTIKLLLLGGPVASLIPSFIQSYLLVYVGITPADSLFSNALAGWSGNSLGVLIITPIILLFIDLPGKVDKTRKWVVTLPVLLTLILVIFLFENTTKKENERIQTELHHHAFTIGTEINRELTTHINFTRQIRDTILINGDVNLDAFNRATQSVLDLHPDIIALSWNELVGNEKRLIFERKMKSVYGDEYQITQEDNWGRMVPSETVEEYAPVAHIAPYESNKNSLGFNLLSNPELKSFFYAARDTGQPQVSGKVDLVKEGQSLVGIITYLPVYKENSDLNTKEQRQSAFIANIASINFLDDIVTPIIDKFKFPNTHIEIHDVSDANNVITLFSQNDVQDLYQYFAINFDVEAGNRHWNISITPNKHYFIKNASNVWVILVIGMSFAALLTILLLISTGQKARIDDMVTIRTNSLNIAKEELRLLAITFESHEAIMILDSKSNILRVNQAFTDITGYSESEVLNQSPSILSSTHNDPQVYDEMWKQLTTLGRFEGELWNQRKNGDVYPERQTITVIKDSNDEIVNYIFVFSDITEKKDNEQRILDLAFYDPLTSLPNRRLLIDRLEQEINQANRNNTFGTLIFLDLDDFKKINDSLGHEYGDELLKEVGQRLTSIIRESDTISRIGGDEFVILIPSTHDSKQEGIESATFLAEKIVAAFSLPYMFKDYKHFTSTSIGITSYPAGDNDTAQELLRQADTAMYKAKRLGKNTYCFYEPEMQSIAEESLSLEYDLRTAIDLDELHLNYQPQFNAFGQVISAEVLVRWQHEKRGLVSPADFIPLAEDSGLIVPLGQYVMLQACTQMQEWLESGIELQHISVNVSPKQFRQIDFIADVKSVLEMTDLPPEKLMLEITEGIVIDNIDDTIRKMDSLKKIGIQFSIDDFGTGYSSLSYLKRLPIDELKIDQSFVQDISAEDDNSEIVGTIISMAAHLNLVVVAEGVETNEQLEFLIDHGCDLFQGYHYSRPLSTYDFHSFMLANYS